MIQERLDNEIFSHVFEHLQDVRLIVMHPRTWILLHKEILSEVSLRGYNVVGGWALSDNGASTMNAMAINPFGDVLKYKGIKILRSLDVKEGLFEIG